MESDLYRLVLGADNTLWANDADLEFAYRGRRALGQAHGPLDELGEDDHAARLLGVAQRRGPNLGKRRRCQCERRHKQHGQLRTFYLEFHVVPSFYALKRAYGKGASVVPYDITKY